MTKKIAYIAVDASFRRKLKIESSIQGMSMIEYTKYLASGDSIGTGELKLEKQKRFKYSI